MSIAAIQMAAEESVIEDDSDYEESIPLGVAPKLSIVPDAPKRAGRPQLHDWLARSYFLTDEVTAAFADPGAFIEKMATDYAISDERLAELREAKVEVGPSKSIEYTLSGAISTVMDLAQGIIADYPGADVKIKMSKVKIVMPKHKLYKAPETVVSGTNAKGLPQVKMLSAEYSPTDISVYLTITP
jgi:hypothetical protein